MTSVHEVIIKALHYESKKWRRQFLDGKKLLCVYFVNTTHKLGT